MLLLVDRILANQQNAGKQHYHRNRSGEPGELRQNGEDDDDDACGLHRLFYKLSQRSGALLARQQRSVRWSTVLHQQESSLIVSAVDCY